MPIRREVPQCWCTPQIGRTLPPCRGTTRLLPGTPKPRPTLGWSFGPGAVPASMCSSAGVPHNCATVKARSDPRGDGSVGWQGDGGRDVGRRVDGHILDQSNLTICVQPRRRWMSGDLVSVRWGSRDRRGAMSAGSTEPNVPFMFFQWQPPTPHPVASGSRSSPVPSRN